MDKAKLIQTGRSQAVRLPAAYWMPGEEVTIRREGNKVILEPISNSWDSLIASLEELPGDFLMEGRKQQDSQPAETRSKLKDIAMKQGIGDIVRPLD